MKYLLLLALLLAHACPAAEGEVAPSLSAYERLPAIEDIAISPQGDKLATVRVEKDARTIVIVDLASGNTLTRIAAGGLRIGGIQWADNRYLVILTRNHGTPFNMTASRDVDWLQGRVYDTVARTARQFPFDGDNLGTGNNQVNAVMGPIGTRVIDGHDYLIFASPVLVGNRMAPIITRMNLDTGEQIMVRRGDGSTTGWLLDERGKVLALSGYDTATERFYITIMRAAAAGYSGKVESDAPSILGFTSTGEDLLISAPRDGGLIWAPMSIADGKWKPTLPQAQTAQYPLRERVGDRVFGGVTVSDDVHYFFFDPKRTEAWNTVMQLFPGEHLVLRSWSDDFNRLVVTVDGAKDGFSEQLIDVAAARATSLGTVFEGINHEFLSETVHYQSGDGHDITGFLTLPEAQAKTGLPLVVVVHDGPRSRDAISFDVWSQALASQGYAVLRTNFRGSATTRDWANAGRGELADKALTDVLDGVNDLAAKGIVDPARVCIMGTGYGGYMALASVTLLAQQPYRCAVSVSGWADAKGTLRYLRGELKTSEPERVLMQLLGVGAADDAKLDAVSPIKHVASTSASVLLIHGTQDAAFPVQQSEDFYDAMRSAGKHVEIVKPDSQNDMMLRADSRRQEIDAAVAFLKKNNPPD